MVILLVHFKMKAYSHIGNVRKDLILFVDRLDSESAEQYLIDYIEKLVSQVIN